MRWRLCCPFAGIVAFVALAASPSFCWQLCPHFLRWHCCPWCTCVAASIALASLPVLCWSCCPCQTCIFAFIVLSSLPLFCWRLCHCCAGIVSLCTGIVTLVIPASSPVLCWCHCLCCNGISAVAFCPCAAINDLVLDFDRGLDHDANPKLAQALFHDGHSCNAITHQPRCW